MMLLSRTLTLMGLCLILAPIFGQDGAQAQSRSANAAATMRLTGTYTRTKRHPGENQSAILDLKQISADVIKFDLTALWWPVGAGRFAAQWGD